MAFQRLALTHRVQLLMCSCLATESSNPPTVTRNSEPLIYLLPVTEQQANNIKTDLELQIRIISIMLIQNQHADDVDSDHMGACDKDYVPETFQ